MKTPSTQEASVPARLVRKLKHLLHGPPSHGPEGIAHLGHRTYVGGMWHEIGKLQFDFLVEHGLRPAHYLIDAACGSLRAGTLLIPYLEEGRYLGIDKEEELIQRGLAEEVTAALVKLKKPEFVVSSDFAFERFSHAPDFAIAQSLFSHLPEDIIRLCLRKLRAVAKPQTLFYATYFETATKVENSRAPHDSKSWFYTRDEMAAFGRETGWTFEYIGDWKHPRGQVITAYRPV